MQILEKRQALLSNYEVLLLLAEQKKERENSFIPTIVTATTTTNGELEDRSPRLAVPTHEERISENVLTIEFEVCTYGVEYGVIFFENGLFRH